MKKIERIIKIIQKLVKNKKIDIYDDELMSEFDCSKKTLSRDIEELNSLDFWTIKKSREGKRSILTLEWIDDVLKEFLSKDYDIEYMLEILRDESIALLKESEINNIKKLLIKDEIFVFKNPPFENIVEEKRELFNNLKKAIGKNQFLNIYYEYDENEIYKNVKPLKIIYSQNNWYIGAVLENSKFKFFRINFISNIEILNRRFNPNGLIDYFKFIKNFQNLFTLYHIKPKIVKVKISKKIAKYFNRTDKPLLNSQKIIKRNSDGTLIVQYSYTQPLEILPLIKKWLPDMKILEPQELKDKLREDLQKALKEMGEE